MTRINDCYRFYGTTQNYAWGKVGTNGEAAKLAFAGGHETSIDNDKAYAELWLGSHPNGMGRISLPDQGEESLGHWLHSHEGSGFNCGEGELPFLLKVLSIEKALSIQSHPDKALARRLHADQPSIYKDGNHKPEIAIALSDEFKGLCGFRPLSEIKDFVRTIPELRNILGEALSAELSSSLPLEGDEAGMIKSAYSMLMEAPDNVIAREVSSLCHSEPSSDAYRLALELNRQFPGGDVGVFSPFFLNIVSLKRGECLYMAPNTPHAYLKGDIVECMACSDNVIRGGLTPKLKDIPTLLSSLDFSPSSKCSLRLAPSHLKPNQEGGRGVECQLYKPPLHDFEVTRVVLPSSEECGEKEVEVQLNRSSLSLCLVTSGRGKVGGLSAERGSAFVLRGGSTVRLQGEAEEMELFLASTGSEFSRVQI